MKTIYKRGIPHNSIYICYTFCYTSPFLPRIYIRIRREPMTMTRIIQKWFACENLAHRERTKIKIACVPIGYVIELKTNYLPNDAARICTWYSRVGDQRDIDRRRE